MRRGLRLSPAYVALLAGCWLVLAIAPKDVNGAQALARFPRTAAFGLAYVFNWKVAYSTHYTAGTSHLWSLSVGRWIEMPALARAPRSAPPVAGLERLAG